jgi:hypothetical protein
VESVTVPSIWPVALWARQTGTLRRISKIATTNATSGFEGP